MKPTHRFNPAHTSPWLAGLFVLGALLSGCERASSVATPPDAPAGPPPAFRLTNVATERGLDFRHTHGSSFPLTIVEAMGGGCAFLDFDGDGHLDVFLVNSGADFRRPSNPSGSRLFRNRGDGTFEDVTASSGLRIDTYGMGTCAGDFDNDGWIDLFVTGFGRNYLFRNRGDGTFEDVTERAGILRREGGWGMGCAFVDINGNGLLDLYVAHYVVYDDALPLCPTGDTMAGCTPNQYATQANELYVNLGNGRFAERAAELGAEDASGAGLGVVVADFDNDGRPDIFIANDGTPDSLLHNEGGRFRNVGDESGVAYSEGVMRAGMGTCAADATGDGLFDLVVTNFQHEPNTFWLNRGEMQFSERTYPSGVGGASVVRLAFGVAFVDLDGDGLSDLYIGNGHVFDNVEDFDDTASFEQVDQILRNTGDGRFDVVAPESGAYPAVPSVSRGVTVGDFDNDGTPDLLINSLGRPVRLLRNERTHAGNWLGLRLRGTRSNRSAIGARVELRTPGGLQVREVRSGGSYLSQPDLRPLFALGDVDDPALLELRIRWPGGTVQTLRPDALNRYLDVEEPRADGSTP